MKFIKNIIKIIAAILSFLIVCTACLPNPFTHYCMIIIALVGIPVYAYCMTYNIKVYELIEKLKNL